MHIEEINWLDIGEEEAVLKVVSDADCLICFSCPCSYNVGDVLVEPLECLDTENIILCERTENIIEKMVEGRLNKNLKEMCLVDQEFIKNPDETVAKFLGEGKVLNMVRFQVGEGMEKREENFAEEVAAQMKA